MAEGLFYITDLWDRLFKESSRFTNGFFYRYWPAEHARYVYEGKLKASGSWALRFTDAAAL